MSFVNFQISSQLNDCQKSKIQRETTQLLSRFTKKNESATVVNISESLPDQWAVNGSPLSKEQPPSVFVDIKLAEGNHLPSEQSTIISKIVEMLSKILGSIRDTCYVVINEVTAMSWGYQGRTALDQAYANVKYWV